MQASLHGVRFEEDVAISPVQRALILKTFPGFANLGSADLAVLASVCRERFFPKDTTILSPDVPVVAFYLVVEGSVGVLRRGKVAQELGPRSSVGGLAALTRDPKGTHAVTLQDTLALEIDTDDMQDVFEDNFNILLGVLGAMAQTMRSLQQEKGGAAQSARTFLAGVDVGKKLSLVDKMVFLKNTTNFADTSVEALADLAACAEEKRVPAGEEIWALGEQADGSILVVDGTVTCEPRDGEPFDFTVGYVVGGLDSLAREARWYRARAKTDLTYLRLQRTNLYDVLEDHIDTAMALLRGLARGVLALLDAQAAAARRSEPPPPDPDDEA